MRIAIGNDHAAVAEKQAVQKALEALGHTMTNVGTDTDDSTDYPDYAGQVARLVASGESDCGILLCGTGIGMSIAANKVHGVRAALCHSVHTAEMSREHNNANVLCCGARVMSLEDILASVRIFIETDFAGGRHERRVDKMMGLEGGS